MQWPHADRGLWATVGWCCMPCPPAPMEPQTHRATFTKKVVKRVPVAWVGVASEVKLMGEFDLWTRGYELSAGDIDSDGVYKTFEGNVPLLPGGRARAGQPATLRAHCRIPLCMVLPMTVCTQCAWMHACMDRKS